MTLDDRLQKVIATLPLLSESLLRQVEALCLQPTSRDIVPRTEVST